MTTISFPYRQRLAYHLLPIVGLAGLTAGCAWKGATNSEPLLVRRLFELSVSTATTFWWASALLFGAMAVLAVAFLVFDRSAERRITLSERSLRCPKHLLSRQGVDVFYRDVRRMTVQAFRNERILVIRHPGGTLCIAQRMLPDKRSFDRLRTLLAERVPA